MASVPININGNALAGSSVSHQPGGPGQVIFTVNNNDNTWVDVEVLIDGEKLWNSGHVGAGNHATATFPIGRFAGRTVKHCRWRPGFLGAAGTGGGDAYWVCPTSGTVTVTLKHASLLMPMSSMYLTFRETIAPGDNRSPR